MNETPAQWLIAEYETASLEDLTRDEAAEAVPGPSGSVYIQPIFTLKRVTDSGHPMRVQRRDYRDPGRWWL